MPDKLLKLKNDLVFQELFGKSKNSQITAHFLSLILGKEIHNIDLDVNKRMIGNRQDSKTGRLDVRAKFNNGEDCNIELQIAPYPYMPERMLFYWGSMYQNKLNSGKDYEELKPSISILITDYKLKQLENISKYHTIWNLREKDYTYTVLTNNIELHILEIPKIKNSEILKDELVQWLKFIENPESKEVEKFMCENKFLKQAKEELAYLSGDEAFQYLVEARAGFLMDQAFAEAARERKGRAEGRAEGLTIGESKGSRKKQIEIAKNLLKLKIPKEKIAQATGLSLKELEKLS